MNILYTGSQSVNAMPMYFFCCSKHFIVSMQGVFYKTIEALWKPK